MTGIDRRALFSAAMAMSAASAFTPKAQAATKDSDALVAADGDYKKLPLAKPFVRLGVMQTRVRGIDSGSSREAAKGRKANLEHMLDTIDAASGWGGRKDILFFHEFPITGYRANWKREDVLRVGMQIPGEETEAIGKKAKQYGCYIVFGSYATDPDWPNHVLSITTIIGPDGEVLDKHWKPRNIKGVFGPGFELFTTTIYDVLEQYIEMYGMDHVLPITRTPVGNLVTSSAQREPELFRAYAMKGGEIFLRTATGGFTPADIQATSLYNGVYTAVANNAVSPGNPGFLADNGGAGGSAVYGPDGKLMDEANSENETIITVTLPMASYRKRHTLPYVHMDLYRPIFEQYQNRFPPNLFADYQPTDTSDAYQYLKDKGVWK
ncbi:MAG: nitrilase-related carbon-nitrogen hydrolase [Pseudomonadota bacterium]